MNSCRNYSALPVVIVLTMATIFSTSCIKRPNDVLSNDEMASLVADFEIANAYADRNQEMRTDSARKVLRQSIMLSHGVNQERYEASIDWYGHNMDQYAEVIDIAGKRIKQRSKELSGIEGIEDPAVGLWPNQSVAMISPLAYTRTLSFSIPAPVIEQGALLEWRMHLSDERYLQMLIGVDYDDGSMEYTYTETSRNRKPLIMLQTDSQRNVTRIYGRLEPDKNKNTYLWIDSLNLTSRPAPPQEYNQRRRRQKTFFNAL